MRNMLKIIEEGRTLIKKRPAMDISIQETKIICDRMREGKYSVEALWNNIEDAYLLGMMTGYKAAKRDMAKKKA